MFDVFVVGLLKEKVYKIVLEFFYLVVYKLIIIIRMKYFCVLNVGGNYDML